MCHIAAQRGIVTGVCEESFCFQGDRLDFRSAAQRMGLGIEFKDSLSYEWLATNQKYIFAPMKLQAKFYGLRQQATVKKWAKATGKAAMVFGRRKQENTIPSPLYQTVDKAWQCHPIHDWTTVEVWTYISQYGLAYPRIYDTELGRMEGASPWLTLDPVKWAAAGLNMWQAVYDRESPIVTKLAAFHAPAAAFLESL